MQPGTNGKGVEPTFSEVTYQLPPTCMDHVAFDHIGKTHGSATHLMRIDSTYQTAASGCPVDP